ncbi:MAG: hypothetical protein GY932_02665 [Arcobacter sp.]|nr:hypothetical protein [Arcobacter sp.]
MKIITFTKIDQALIDVKHTVELYEDGCSGDAEIVIIDIDTIFDFEENKTKVCSDKYTTVAILEDDSDYEAFKNFGVDTWIKSDDLSEFNSLLNLIEKRL